MMYKLNTRNYKNYLKSNRELVKIILQDLSFIASQFYAVNIKFIAIQLVIYDSFTRLLHKTDT